MASLDNLPGDQRAVVELVLRQGRGYDEIEQLLSIDRTAVRARALAALDALAPAARLSEPKRALIADYVLGQLPPRVAKDVAASLARSPDERAWAEALVSELAPIASRPLPEIPRESRQIPRESSHGETPARPSSRLGGAILLGVGALVAVAVVVVLLTRSGSTHPAKSPRSGAQASASTTTRSTATSQPKVLTQINLLPPGGTGAAKGIAQVLSESGKLAVVIVASGLRPNTKHDIYAVWLYSGPSQEVRIGFVNPGVGSNGRIETVGLLPANAASYDQLLVTLEPEPPPSTPGTVVLDAAVKIP